MTCNPDLRHTSDTFGGREFTCIHDDAINCKELDLALLGRNLQKPIIIDLIPASSEDVFSTDPSTSNR
jgi:hypothetical protein